MCQKLNGYRTPFLSLPPPLTSSTSQVEKMSIDMDSAVAAAQAILRAEREQARSVALLKQRKAEADAKDLAAREQALRIKKEAERIQAELVAKQQLIEAEAKAEKEAHDAAVAEILKGLRERPETEVLRAEVEEMREQLALLRGEFGSSVEAPIKAIRRDYESGLTSLEKRFGVVDSFQTELINTRTKDIPAIRSELTEIRKLLTRPKRDVQVWFSSAMGFPVKNQNTIHIDNGHSTHALTLTLQYHLIPQTATGAQGSQMTHTIADCNAAVISVPEGHKIFVTAATVQYPGNVNYRSVTALYKMMLEGQ